LKIKVAKWSTAKNVFKKHKERYLGPSMSGTCKKLLLFGFETNVGGEGAARANISATGTCRYRLSLF
jgi:hypothetical protein